MATHSLSARVDLAVDVLKNIASHAPVNQLVVEASKPADATLSAKRKHELIAMALSATPPAGASQNSSNVVGNAQDGGSSDPRTDSDPAHTVAVSKRPRRLVEAFWSREAFFSRVSVSVHVLGARVLLFVLLSLLWPLTVSCVVCIHDVHLAGPVFSQTFTLGNWFGKPLQVGPLECARFGWECSGKDLISCSSCHATHNCRIDPTLSVQALVGVVTAFREKIINGHKAHCRWEGNPCPASYSTFPAATNEQLLKGYDQRLELCEASGVPPLKLNAESDVVKAVNSDAGSVQSKTTARPLGPWSLVAACGWEVHKPQSGKGVLLCRMCNRKLGPWNFAPASGSSADASEGDQKQLDPVAEHRWFCPWVCGVSTAGPEGADSEGASGWQRVIEALSAAGDEPATSSAPAPDSNAAKADESKTSSHSDIIEKSKSALEFLHSTLSV